MSVELFEKYFSAKPEKIVSAAGRINIIGEHVDYCGGKVFPASLNLKSEVYARANGTNFIRIVADGLGYMEVLDIDKLDSYKHLKWGNYQAGVAYYLKEAGYNLVGCDILYTCSVPFGSGLSSSAAIEVSTAVVLNELAGNKYDLKEMAIISQRAENKYCNVNCGIMDQFASAMGKKDSAVLLNCKTLDYEYVPLKLEGYDLVVVNSNKRHSLNDGSYNKRREEVEEGLNAVKSVKSDITCLADLTVDDLKSVEGVLSGKVKDRVEHVVMECDRVKKSVEALKNGDIVALGQLLNASHDSLSRLYEVTGFELDTLANLERTHEGCLGARMIGGGFGGCTISIVKKENTEQFIKDVDEAYERAVGYKASFYATSIEDGVSVKNL